MTRVALHFAKVKEGRDADMNRKFPVDQTVLFNDGSSGFVVFVGH